MNQKKEKINKKHTPPHETGVYSSVAKEELESVGLEDIEFDSEDFYESRDSSPTPIFSLGYREFHARFKLLGSRFESQAFVFRKHPLKIDLKKAEICKKYAAECQRLASRIETWPNLTPAALSGERNWMTQRYMDIILEAEFLFEGKPL